MVVVVVVAMGMSKAMALGQAAAERRWVVQMVMATAVVVGSKKAMALHHWRCDTPLPRPKTGNQSLKSSA